MLLSCRGPPSFSPTASMLGHVPLELCGDVHQTRGFFPGFLLRVTAHVLTSTETLAQCRERAAAWCDCDWFTELMSSPQVPTCSLLPGPGEGRNPVVEGNTYMAPRGQDQVSKLQSGTSSRYQRGDSSSVLHCLLAVC
jgi:hypothetical protein